MNNNSKISVIVPVYNIENYIKDCIESVINNDYTNFELIIINDASTDNTLEAIKKTINNDSRIKVINLEENRGISYCRNLGLNESTGEYIHFLDGDDRIFKNIYSFSLNELSKNNLDIITFSNKKNKKTKTTIINKDEYLKTIFKFDNNSNKYNVWRYIFKKDFLLKNNITFLNDMYYEDLDFSFNTINKVSKIEIIDQKFYEYVDRTESISNNLNEKMLKDRIEILEKIKFENNNNLKECIDNAISITKIQLIDSLNSKKNLENNEKQLITYSTNDLKTNKKLLKKSNQLTRKQKFLLFLETSKSNIFSKIILKLTHKILGTTHESITFRNTLFLYILRVTTFLFSFITMSYLGRVLGVIKSGDLSFAWSISMYFSIVMDFGFLLSGTKEIIKNKGNQKKINSIVSSILFSRMIFSVILIIIGLILIFFVPNFKEIKLALGFYLLDAIIYGFVPDYIYRGYEKMKFLAIFSATSKFSCMLTSLLFIKNPSQYYLVPLFQLITSTIILITALIDTKLRFNIKISKPDFKYIKKTIIGSKEFFLGRLLNVVFFGISSLFINLAENKNINNAAFYENEQGYFGQTYKIIEAGRTGLYPIGDSIYPYMIVKKNFKLIKKILLIFMPVIILLCTIVAIFPDKFIVFIYGEKFKGASNTLLALLPMAVFSLPEIILGYPSLGAMNKINHANYALYISSAFQLISLIVMLCINKISSLNIAICLSIAFFINMMYKIIANIYFYKKIKKMENTK